MDLLTKRLEELNVEIEVSYKLIDEARDAGQRRRERRLFDRASEVVLDYHAVRSELCLADTEPV